MCSEDWKVSFTSVSLKCFACRATIQAQTVRVITYQTYLSNTRLPRGNVGGRETRKFQPSQANTRRLFHPPSADVPEAFLLALSLNATGTGMEDSLPRCPEHPCSYPLCHIGQLHRFCRCFTT
ncbi:uncharacterized protein CIMG_13396 [Coccidioides immitis RS]|uniref:Uncharacterized protein n=1 Tax=Coccidioides immitis (strain RS) TaxID=246410 RepID=A0A0D8JUS1_COCIM|nr:uncharacterized protein CIMG_13396 [Coccidioides immitis RS]KJF61052.1 hypothetical protein CIMG_13396 [Coccidioides immitis RS]